MLPLGSGLISTEATESPRSVPRLLVRRTGGAGGLSSSLDILAPDYPFYKHTSKTSVPFYVHTDVYTFLEDINMNIQQPILVSLVFLWNYRDITIPTRFRPENLATLRTYSSRYFENSNYGRLYCKPLNKV